MIADPLPYRYPWVGIASKSEFQAYLSLLERFKTPTLALVVFSLSQVESDAFIALRRGGFLDSAPNGGWEEVRTTAKGAAWLAEVSI